MTPRARVAHFLLGAFERHEVTNLIDVPMSRRDMAEQLGQTVETLCRLLTLFAEARIIAIPNVSQIEIIDVGALERIAQSS